LGNLKVKDHLEDLHRMNGNIKMNLKETECKLDSTGSGWGPVTGL
jgi:hypothetical protein